MADTFKHKKAWEDAQEVQQVVEAQLEKGDASNNYEKPGHHRTQGTLGAKIVYQNKKEADRNHVLEELFEHDIPHHVVKF